MTSTIFVGLLGLDDAFVLCDELITAAKRFGGIGLAANQLGFTERVAVMLMIDGSWLRLVDPAITQYSENIVQSREGCLSFPGLAYTVERHDKIMLEHTVRDGSRILTDLSGLSAVVAQHEIDHLNGITLQMRANKTK